jgi:hypothetical protein|eukprot:SAG25_NODE_274_length_10583_cov_9.951068_12_plen_58_part_00
MKVPFSIGHLMRILTLLLVTHSRLAAGTYSLVGTFDKFLTLHYGALWGTATKDVQSY